MLEYDAAPYEEVVHKTATKSKMAVISIVHTRAGPMVAFKIIHIFDDGDRSRIRTNADGIKEVYEFFIRDIGRIHTVADILRVGRPIPFGIPYRVAGQPDRTGLLRGNQEQESSVPNRELATIRPEYTSDRIISLATNTKQFLRTCRFFARPEYGHAIQMEIIVRDAQSTASRPRVAVFDFSEFEAMVAFAALARALAKLDAKPCNCNQ